MTTSAFAVARKDLTDLARSKLVWAATLVFLGLTVPQTHRTATNAWNQFVDPTQARLLVPFALFVGPVAAVAGYAAVVGERESGSLRVLLSFPTDRGSVVLGKAVSRTVLLTTLALGTYAVLGGILIQEYGTLDVAEYLADAGLLVVYTFTWTGLAVGVSAAISTQARAVGLLFGLYLTLGPLGLWRQTVVRAAGVLLGDDVATLRNVYNPSPEAPEWFLYVGRTNPTQAFLAANEWTSQVLTPSTETVYRNGLVHNAFGVLVLLAWGIVPLLVGYLRLQRTDLG